MEQNYRTEIPLKELFEIIDRQVSWRSDSLRKRILRACNPVNDKTDRVEALLRAGCTYAYIRKQTGTSYERIKRIEHDLHEGKECVVRPIHHTQVVSALQSLRCTPGRKPWTSIMRFLTSDDPEVSFEEIMDQEGVFAQRKSEVRRLLSRVRKELAIQIDKDSPTLNPLPPPY